MIIHESINRNKFAQEQYLNNPNKDNPKKKKKRNKPITKKTKHQHKYSRKWSSKHEIWGKEIRTHTFFLKIWRWKSAKMEFVEGDMECLDEFQLRKKWGRQWIVTKSRGKNWKSLKKLSLKRKTCVFCDWNKSPRQAAKTLKVRIVKKFLSVFRDYKVYSRGSRELSRENLCVPLTTGPFTREQVAKINTQARGCSMRLGWPAAKSPKQGNTVFEIF